ncbi:S41 family peptidase [Shewanella sp. 10N.286.48.B5]|uniref:S41 family peptidase n=1 Tax=Shewanella sp. 10N.286.48.B5 TaxID=1880834 RepID=UPI000C81FF14|nr:S41 family peptidase [Shewanella sp. 10N.286.48.B5]PMH89473.1 carboxyl-terminal protease [Shewanella sp. 10N.286.48.B5]
MMQITRYILCFILGVSVAFSLNLSSSEQHYKTQSEYSYSLLLDVIDTVHTYYFNEVDREDLIEYAIEGIFNKLDPYSGFLDTGDYQSINDSNNGQYFGFGFEVATDDNQITIITPYANSPAARANIQPGDKVLQLNDTLIDQTNLTDVLTEIKQHSINKRPITLTIERQANETLLFNLAPELIHIKSINAKIIDNNIGYIQLNSFQEDATNAIINQAKLWQQQQLKGLIIDVRNNPGGLLSQAISIADLFLQKGLIVSTEGRFFDANENYYASQATIFKGVPMVVLINKGSASASEVLAAALQENNRATLVGETSFGKGTVQSLIPMLDMGNAIKLTIAKYSTPDGNDIHTKGIEPDIKISNDAILKTDYLDIIEQTTAQYDEPQDGQISSAIAWITTHN